MPNIHLISGLPRSGSTLLSSILLQNPDVWAGTSSPLLSLLNSVLNACNHIEARSEINDPLKIKILKNVIDGFFYGKSANTIFDSNRFWTGNMRMVKDLLPSTKILCLVRNPAWIVNSLECFSQKIWPSRPLYMPNDMTLEGRISKYMEPNGIIGAPYSCLKEALYGPYSNNILIIDYDALCYSPDKVMKIIYDFIGMNEYHHNYEEIAYKNEEFDNAMNASGLHDVIGPIEKRNSQNYLSSSQFMELSKLCFWKNFSEIKSNAIFLEDGEFSFRSS